MDLNAYMRIYAYIKSVTAKTAKLNTYKPLLLVLLSSLICV
jgi:hypothetical protein